MRSIAEHMRIAYSLYDFANHWRISAYVSISPRCQYQSCMTPFHVQISCGVLTFTALSLSPEYRRPSIDTFIAFWWTIIQFWINKYANQPLINSVTHSQRLWNVTASPDPLKSGRHDWAMLCILPIRIDKLDFHGIYPNNKASHERWD